MRIGHADGETWLRLNDAARLLGISLNTLRRWSDAGKITCYRSPGGHRRFRRSDIEELLQRQGRDAGGRSTDGSPPSSAGGLAVAAQRQQGPLGTLARVAAEGVGVTTCRIIVLAGDGAVVAAMYDRDGARAVPERLPPPARSAVAAQVLRTGRRLVMADVEVTQLLTAEEAELHRQQGARAILGVPLTADGRLSGVLELTDVRGPHTFTGANVAFAEFVARQATELLDTELGRPTKSAGVGVQSAPVPAEGPQTGPEAPSMSSSQARSGLVALCERLWKDLAAVACDIYSYDRQADALTLVATADASEERPLLEGLVCPLHDLPDAAAVLESGEPLRVACLDERADDAPGFVRRRHNGAHNLLCAPIRLGDDVVGVIDVYSAEPERRFDREALGLVEATAALAALAIAGGDGSAAVDRRIAQLDELIAGFVERSPASEAEAVVAAALQALLRQTGATTCTVYHIEDGIAHATLAAGTAKAEGPWRLEEYPPAAAAAADRLTVVVPSPTDARMTSDAAARFLEPRGLTAVVLSPLCYRDELVGLLEVGCPGPSRLDDIAERARVLGSLFAGVLASGEALTRLQRRNRDLALVVEAGLEDTARLSTHEVLHAVVARLAELTRSPVADIYAVEGDTLQALVSYDSGHYDDEWEGVVLPLRRYPCSRRAVETGEIAVIADLDDPMLTPEGRYSLEKWGYSSQLSMPLLAGGRVIGLVELSDYVPRDFAADLELVRGLGQVAGHALENAALFEQVEGRNRVLNELVELGALADQTRDLDGFVRAAAERLLQTVDASNCDIFRLDSEGLRCMASWDRSGYDEQTVGAVLERDKYPTLAAAVAARQVLVISSPDDPQLGDDERRTYREYGFGSEVCIPLVVNDELLGLVDVYDTRERDYAEYLSFLRSAAQTLAGAFGTAHLVGQLEARGRALREVVEIGAVTAQTHDLPQILATIAARLRETVGAADCDIFALQEDRLSCLVSADRDGLDESVVGHVLDLERFPATALAVRNGEIMTVGSPDDPRLTPEEREDFAEFGFQSELCIPLAAGDQVIGLIDLFDTRSRDYAEYLDFLLSVGQMAAGAIENALLVEELERSNQAQAELVELGRMVSTTRDLDRLCRLAGPRIVDAMKADGCQVFTVEDGKLHCLLTYENGEYQDEYVGRPLDLELFPSTRDALDKRELLIVTSPDDERLSEYERRLYRESGARSEICAPLTVEGRLVGLLDVYDHRERDYAEYRDFVTSVAQTLAGAFENAVLFERLDRGAARMGLVSDVSLELGSSLDIGDVLRSAANRLCAVAEMPMCDIYRLVDDRLVDVVSISKGEVDLDWQGREFPLDGWATLATAVRTREPVIIESLDDPLLLPEERQLMEDYGETAEVAVPLIAKDRVIGVLELLDCRGPRRFSQEELGTIVAVCRVAALAIDNADLVADLQLRSRESELLNEIARATGASLNLRDIAGGALEKLGKLVPFERALVALKRDERAFDVVYVSEPRRSQLPDVLEVPPVGGLLERLRDEKVVPLRVPEDVPAGFLLPDLDQLSAALLIALLQGDEVAGVICLGATSRKAFETLDRRLLERMATHLSLAIHNSGLYEDIKQLHLGNLKALSSALNAKDYYTLGHAARVAAYMVLLGEELGWPVELLRQVEEAAYLHDIGKIGVSDRVLLKPSGLNQREWDLMRQHPIFSAEIIRSLFDEPLVLGVRHHHERWEGGGYPDGLTDGEIPIIARAMCVVDSYDAMSFRRPYRQALSYRQCLDELEACRGKQFDPGLVDAFTRVLERLSRERETAMRVAAEAAAVIDARKHATLRSPGDEERPEYADILAALRTVRDANPPTRYITTHIRLGKKIVAIVDTGEGDGPDPEGPHIGDEVIADDELMEGFAGRTSDVNVLYVDQWGVWISGVAPVYDEDGAIVAVVTADIPATRGMGGDEGLHSNVSQAFTAMLHTATAQAGRSEVEAITDGLTGLYNHRYFHERLDEELARCLDSGGDLSLLFCDLDGFRAFNERHGHRSGDRALRAVGRAIEGAIRHIDLAARFGGEEFAAILIDTGEAGALEVAERMRSAIAELTLTPSGDGLSASIGVASCPADAATKEELIDKADWAMYLAKRRGRDRVLAFSAEHGSDTPEQAAVVGSEYVRSMSELVVARQAYERRRRSALARLALAVGRELGLGGDELRVLGDAAVESSDPGSLQTRILTAAATYQALVTDRPYRAQLSEAEALEELLNCPALLYDRPLADALARALGRAPRP